MERIFHQKFGYGEVSEIDGDKVTVEFEKDGVPYKIERGRKPNFLKYYVDNHDQEYSFFEKENL